MCYWDGRSNLRRELLFYLSHKLKNSYCSGKIQERIVSALSAEEWTLLHRTTEGTPRLEMPLKDHLVQPFLETGASMRSSSMLSSLVLKICSDEDSTTSLARLYSWLIVLTVKHVSYTEVKPVPVQLVPIALCFLHVLPGEESTSILCCHL